MKHLIIFFLILISLTFISCDTDYSGDATDTFNVYYAVEDPDSSGYSLEFYVNSTNDTITLVGLRGDFISDTLNINHHVTESDLYYVKLTKVLGSMPEDTLVVKVYKGWSMFDSDSLFGTGEVELKGQF